MPLCYGTKVWGLRQKGQYVGPKPPDDPAGKQIDDALIPAVDLGGARKFGLQQQSIILKVELRDSDLLVRYAGDDFIAISPKMSREQAENLKSRLQNELDHFNFAVRSNTEIPLQVSIGIAIFPEDGTELETLLLTAELRMREDRELRTAVRRGVRNIRTAN